MRSGERFCVVGFASGEIPRLPANIILLGNRSVIGVDWGDWARADGGEWHVRAAPPDGLSRYGPGFDIIQVRPRMEGDGFMTASRAGAPRRSGPLRAEPVRKRRIDGERREELLGRLQELLLAEGFAHLTVDDLAARLQCSKSTLYAISSSKEFLVTTVLKRFFRAAAERVEAQVASIARPSDQIAAYLAAVGTEMRRMSTTCYADMMAHDSTREIYAVNSAAAARRVREFIQQGVESGKFRALHAEFVGEAVSLLIEGIQHGELLERTGLSSGDAFTELGDLVLAALTNKSRRRTDGPAA